MKKQYVILFVVIGVFLFFRLKPSSYKPMGMSNHQLPAIGEQQLQSTKHLPIPDLPDQWWNNDSLLFGVGYKKLHKNIELIASTVDTVGCTLPFMDAMICPSGEQGQVSRIHNALYRLVLDKYPMYLVEGDGWEYSFIVYDYSLPIVQGKNNMGQYIISYDNNYDRHMIVNLRSYRDISKVGYMACEKAGWNLEFDHVKVMRRFVMNEIFHMVYTSSIDMVDNEFLSDGLSAYDDGTDSWFPFLANRLSPVASYLLSRSDIGMPSYRRIDSLLISEIVSVLKKDNTYEIAQNEIAESQIELDRFLQKIKPDFASGKVLFDDIRPVLNELSARQVAVIMKYVGKDNLREMQRKQFQYFLDFEATR